MHIVEYLSRCSSKAGDDPTAPLNSGPHNQNLLTFWSATSLPVSVLLIELDRFLAIRFPFKYPHLVNSPRSLALCSVTQLGSLITSVTLWGTKTMGNHNVFLAIIFIPYSICMAACLGCALYVVKTLIHQIRRDNRVSRSLGRMELCVERKIVSFYKPQHFYILLWQIYVQCQMVVAVLQKVKALGFNYFHSFLKYVGTYL